MTYKILVTRKKTNQPINSLNEKRNRLMIYRQLTRDARNPLLQPVSNLITYSVGDQL